MQVNMRFVRRGRSDKVDPGEKVGKGKQNAMNMREKVGKGIYIYIYIYIY
jgi:hypothetical protein